MGLAFDEASGALLLTTQTPNEVTFCSVDVSTGAASSANTLPRGDSESASTSYYAAYVSHVHDGTAVRVGNQMVTTGENLGVARSNVSATVWSGVGILDGR